MSQGYIIPNQYICEDIWREASTTKGGILTSAEEERPHLEHEANTNDTEDLLWIKEGSQWIVEVCLLYSETNDWSL